MTCGWLSLGWLRLIFVLMLSSVNKSTFKCIMRVYFVARDVPIINLNFNLLRSLSTQSWKLYHTTKHFIKLNERKLPKFTKRYKGADPYLPPLVKKDIILLFSDASSSSLSPLFHSLSKNMQRQRSSFQHQAAPQTRWQTPQSHTLFGKIWMFGKHKQQTPDLWNAFTSKSAPIVSRAFFFMSKMAIWPIL